MTSIPLLREHDIRFFVGKQNLKGLRSVHNGAIVNPVQQFTLEADRLSDEEFLRIGRETKSIQEVVTRLLKLKRADEAVQDASQADGWQLVKLADLFVVHGDETEQWTNCIAWLHKWHSRLSTLKEELSAAGL